MRISDWSSDVCSSDLSDSANPGMDSGSQGSRTGTLRVPGLPNAWNDNVGFIALPQRGGSGWPARCHDSVVQSPSPAHPADQRFDMGDRRVLVDAMAEVEDEGAAAERVEDIVRCPLQRGAARKQANRVEVALDRQEGSGE